MEKKLLILEDSDAQRASLHDVFERRNYNVKSAKNVKEARAAAQEFNYDFDVGILDMRLEDPQHPNMTGADVGIEILKTLRSRKTHFIPDPEFIIYSAYPQMDYYNLAFRLNAATYLEKSSTKVTDLIRHVQILSLRRALKIYQEQVLREIEETGIGIASERDEIYNFCQHTLLPELHETLGPKVLVLLGYYGELKIFSDVPELTAGPSAAFQIIQIVSHGRANTSEPLEFDYSSLNSTGYLDTDFQSLGMSDRDKVKNTLQELDKAYFIPVRIDQHLYVTIGLLKQESNGTDRNNKALSKIFYLYMTPSIINSLARTWFTLSAVQEKQRNVLSAVLTCCFHLGQEIDDTLSASEKTGELPLESCIRREMVRLTTSLRYTEQILSALLSGTQEDEKWRLKKKLIGLEKLAKDVVKDMNLTHSEDLDTFVKIEEGSCVAFIYEDEIAVLIAKLLDLFLQRTADSEPEGPSIRVIPEETEYGPSLIFCDNSRVIPKPLRERMFSDFTDFSRTSKNFLPKRSEGEQTTSILPFFLVKIIAELRNDAKIEDHTNDEEKYGNKFIIRFPPVQS
ncbi:response regulator [Thermodesulfobacteriota bacterium]